MCVYVLASKPSITDRGRKTQDRRPSPSLESNTLLLTETEHCCIRTANYLLIHISSSITNPVSNSLQSWLRNS